MIRGRSPYASFFQVARYQADADTHKDTQKDDHVGHDVHLETVQSFKVSWDRPYL